MTKLIHCALDSSDSIEEFLTFNENRARIRFMNEIYVVKLGSLPTSYRSTLWILSSPKRSLYLCGPQMSNSEFEFFLAEDTSNPYLRAELFDANLGDRFKFRVYRGSERLTKILRLEEKATVIKDGVPSTECIFPYRLGYITVNTQDLSCNMAGFVLVGKLKSKDNEMKNETELKSKYKYDEAEVRKLLADEDTRIQRELDGSIYRCDSWESKNDMIRLSNMDLSSKDCRVHIVHLCAPNRFTFFKEVSRLELINLKMIPDEPSIQEVVANSKVGDVFETEGHGRLELVEINPSSKYARYVFKGTEKLFEGYPAVNSFSADLQTSNNQPVRNPNWKIVRKL